MPILFEGFVQTSLKERAAAAKTDVSGNRPLTEAGLPLTGGPRSISRASGPLDRASPYPRIHLFERVSANPAVWDALIAIESATNPRLRDEISLMPPERRISGPNASWVMASFE